MHSCQIDPQGTTFSNDNVAVRLNLWPVSMVNGGEGKAEGIQIRSNQNILANISN